MLVFQQKSRKEYFILIKKYSAFDFFIVDKYTVVPYSDRTFILYYSTLFLYYYFTNVYKKTMFYLESRLP